MNSKVMVPKATLMELLTEFEAHCREKELRDSTIRVYHNTCIYFLRETEKAGIFNASAIDAAIISKVLQSLSNCYLSSIRLFLRYLANGGHTDRDYSYLLPTFTRPQPMPSVYSPEEICRIENAVGKARRCSKRDYAMLLFATRLGIRSEDIIMMTFDNLDFADDLIQIIQKKTEIPLCLPMLPEIKTALEDYIANERPAVKSPYVFLTLTRPYSHMAASRLTMTVRWAVRDAGIDPAGRTIGPRALRSSLASSMVNDNIPYDVVRKTLGHSSPNAIKSYARLDIEQLRLYALEVPAATGAFADFLRRRSK